MPEAEFRALCERCESRLEACETGVIGRDGAGYPILLFGQSSCSFRGACAAACESGAMNSEAAREWTVVARVTSSCLSFNAVTCRACEEGFDEGKTCIDCHKGIAHKLPQGAFGEQTRSGLGRGPGEVRVGLMRYLESRSD